MENSLLCGFCKLGPEVEDICGQLHSEQTKEGVPFSAHHRCMQYSAMLIQYKFDHFGGFKIEKAIEELQRGKKLKCCVCRSYKNRRGKQTGATAGCAVATCRRTYHFFCARTDPKTVTKRLVVNFKSSGKRTVLYRVFCSTEHEKIYRQNLKTYLFSAQLDNNSDGSESDENSGGDIDNPLPLAKSSFSSSVISVSEEEIDKKNATPKPTKTSKLELVRQETQNVKDFASEVLDKQDAKESVQKQKLQCDGRGQAKRFKTANNVNGKDSNSEENPKRNNLGRYPQSKECPWSEVNLGPRIPDQVNHGKDKHASDKKDTKNGDCAVCIVAIPECDAGTEFDIRRIVQTCNKVDPERIFMWQDLQKTTKFKSSHYLLHYIHDLSKCLRSNNTKELQKLLFEPDHVKKKMKSEYQYRVAFMEELRDNIIVEKTVERTWISITQNLKEASSIAGAEVGKIVSINGCKGLVLLLNNECDKNRTLRNSLLKTNQTEMFFWSSNTVLKTSENKSAEIEAELKVIKFWLDSQSLRVGQLFVRPAEDVLKYATALPSISSLLAEHFEQLQEQSSNDTKSTKWTDVLIFDNIDNTIVNFSKYVSKTVSVIVNNHQHRDSNLLLCFATEQLGSSFSYADFMQLVDGTENPGIWTAYDPECIPVSCVLIHVMMVKEEKSTDPGKADEILPEKSARKALPEKSARKAGEILPEKSARKAGETSPMKSAGKASETWHEKSTRTYIMDGQQPSTSATRGLRRKSEYDNKFQLKKRKAYI